MARCPRVQSKPLFAATAGLCKAYLKLLRGKLASTALPVQTRQTIHFTSDGRWESFPDAQLDYKSHLIKSFTNDLRSMPEADALVRTLAEERLGRESKPEYADAHEAVSFTDKQVQHDMETQFLRILLHYLERTEDLTFERSQPNESNAKPIYGFERTQLFRFRQRQFRESYAKYELAWLEPAITWHVFIPLLNFDCEIPHCGIDDKLAIVELDPEQKRELCGPIGTLPLSPIGPVPFYETTCLDLLASSRYNITWTYNQGPRQQDMTRELMGTISLALSALRLLHRGNVAAGAIFQRSLSPAVPITGRVTMLQGYQQLKLGECYKLQKADLGKFRALYARLRALSKNRAVRDLHTGLRRFNQACEREQLEDKIIDITVALESTVMSGIKNELRYRFALRGSRLLRSWDPEEAFFALRTLYDLRSAIVHDGKTISEFARINKSELSPSQLVLQAEDMIREILGEYVRQLQVKPNLTRVNDDIEANIRKPR